MIRTKNFALLSLLCLFSSLAMGAATPRVIEMKVVKVGSETRWEPEQIEVKQGEKVKFVLTYTLSKEDGPFDFHGFKIEPLNIEKSVNRNETLEVPATISLKPGTYDISCQFHPKHVGSKLIVVAKGDKQSKTKLDTKGGGSPAQPDQEPSK
jgi:plastocyanin